MIYTWQESDIEVGRWADNDSDCKVLVCISWSEVTKRMDKKYGVTEIGSDGLFLPLGEKQAVADYLNRYKYHPCEKLQKVES